MPLLSSGTAPLKAGQIQFAEPTVFVHNLNTFRVATRPNKSHWGNDRPPVLLSIPRLQDDLHGKGNQPDSKTLVQYYPGDKTKLFLDIDSYHDTEMSAADTYQHLLQQIQPIIAFIAAKTGKIVSPDELVYEKASRWTMKAGQRKWKISCHVFFPEISCLASRILDLLDHLEISSDIVDRAPYRGEQNLGSAYAPLHHNTRQLTVCCYTCRQWQETDAPGWLL